MQLVMILFSLSVVDARVLWYGDPNRPLKASFRTLNRESGEAGTARAVDDPVHGKIWRVNKPSGSKRAEFARTTGSVNNYNIKNGDRVYVGWRVKVKVAGSNKPNGGFAIFQLKTQGNLLQNHPVSIDYDASRKVLNVQGIVPGKSASDPVSPRKISFVKVPMNENTWTTIVLGFNFSKNAKVGFVEAWINGKKQNLLNQNNQQQAYHRTHEEGYMYFKWGAYNETSRRFNITVDMGDMRVGTTLASVMSHLGGSVTPPPPPPQPSTYTLTTNTNGQGTVAKSPNKTNYDEGEEVSLTAKPASGWTFSGWSGAVSGTNNPRNIIMSANRTVTATFTQAATPPPTPTDTGTVFADFQEGTDRTNWGGALYTFNDSSNSGASAENFAVVSNARGDSPAFGGTFTLDQDEYAFSPFVGMGAYMTAEKEEWDISSAEKITFFYKNTGADETVIRIETEESRLLPKTPYHRVSLPPANGWTYIELEWDQFLPPNWSDVDVDRPLDLSKVTKISFQMRGVSDGSVQNGEFWIDEIRLPGLSNVPDYTSVASRARVQNRAGSVYFNRTQNALVYSYPSDVSGMITVSLFALDGTNITSRVINPAHYNGSYTLRIDNLKSNGLYIAQFRSGEFNLTEKVFIKK